MDGDRLIDRIVDVNQKLKIAKRNHKISAMEVVSLEAQLRWMSHLLYLEKLKNDEGDSDVEIISETTKKEKELIAKKHREWKSFVTNSQKEEDIYGTPQMPSVVTKQTERGVFKQRGLSPESGKEYFRDEMPCTGCDQVVDTNTHDCQGRPHSNSRIAHIREFQKNLLRKEKRKEEKEEVGRSKCDTCNQKYDWDGRHFCMLKDLHQQKGCESMACTQEDCAITHIQGTDTCTCRTEGTGYESDFCGYCTEAEEERRNAKPEIGDVVVLETNVEGFCNYLDAQMAAENN